ncbi:ABC transporter ATP-binding protein [Syntrophorhabdus aromaticivorans]|uniref:ABC transporter ATP-binding protein n=1 Tax=Syntrophorhabdus aromaticivorans TaxID=328301 RepID=A0A351U0C7_9BACT|nr:ABC transporter ATP-binding protein [Syntrophorhabdus aromaticivorans]NLW35522.1 ABC transporter ATP-binding protein [Syntrophorhabdus aromaticivorans]HBA53408.1 lipoprotein-releasing system ATP-binding protein LolD [Syntrophorhabdus aromaticivorans]
MSEPILRVSGLKKTFSKNGVEINVLKGIDVEISQGDLATIMGPSGAGKSTFLHILGTLDKPTEGTIYFRDRNVRQFTEDEESRFRNEKVGFVFQFYHLLQDFNVIENIMMPLLIRRLSPADATAKAENFLDIMGLASRKNHKPGELSGGEQQRVAIARALVNEPEIILADEPTGNLDRKTGKEVLNYLLSVNERLSSTLVLVTHDPEVGSIGNRRFKMVDGELFTD